MRVQLKKCLYEFVIIKGSISKFGNMYFDGHDTILKENPETGLENPIRKLPEGEKIEAIYFCDKTTCLINVTLNGEQVGDGHLWIPENLEEKGFKIGDSVEVHGYVEAYKKANGVIDYCIKETRNIKF